MRIHPEHINPDNLSEAHHLYYELFVCDKKWQGVARKVAALHIPSKQYKPHMVRSDGDYVYLSKVGKMTLYEESENAYAHYLERVNVKEMPPSKSGKPFSNAAISVPFWATMIAIMCGELLIFYFPDARVSIRDGWYFLFLALAFFLWQAIINWRRHSTSKDGTYFTIRPSDIDVHALDEKHRLYYDTFAEKDLWRSIPAKEAVMLFDNSDKRSVKAENGRVMLSESVINAMYKVSEEDKHPLHQNIYKGRKVKHPSYDRRKMNKNIIIGCRIDGILVVACYFVTSFLPMYETNEGFFQNMYWLRVTILVVVNIAVPLWTLYEYSAYRKLANKHVYADEIAQE